MGRQMTRDEIQARELLIVLDQLDSDPLDDEWEANGVVASFLAAAREEGRRERETENAALREALEQAWTELAVHDRWRHLCDRIGSVLASTTAGADLLKELHSLRIWKKNNICSATQLTDLHERRHREVERARAEEREACAQHMEAFDTWTGVEAAAAIRARGTPPPEPETSTQVILAGASFVYTTRVPRRLTPPLVDLGIVIDEADADEPEVRDPEEEMTWQETARDCEEHRLRETFRAAELEADLANVRGLVTRAVALLRHLHPDCCGCPPDDCDVAAFLRDAGAAIGGEVQNDG